MSANIFISAGEASGEHYGTELIAAIKRQSAILNIPEPAFFGMGGERMAAAGCERIVRSEDMAVMGITEVIRHLPRIYREFRRLKRAIRERRPTLAVLIDFPDIHLKLAAEFHRLGIPVLFFVSPQLWAWKKHRIKQVQKNVDHMLVIFPFEEAFYKSHNVHAEFVGHPLADEPLPSISRAEFARENSLDSSTTWIGLLPGSRIKEIRANLPEMLAAAKLLTEAPSQNNQSFSFLIPLAATLTSAQRDETLALTQLHGTGLQIHLLNDARTTLFHSRASIVASGTATVEAALMGNPFVVVYRVSPLTYAIAKRVVKVPHVAMVNLIAEKRLVPELIQVDFSAQSIVQSLAPLLPDGPERASMMQGLVMVRKKLARQNPESGVSFQNYSASGALTAIDRVAEITLRVVENRSSGIAG
jgi:lipid-A-disaccharide synthase